MHRRWAAVGLAAALLGATPAAAGPPNQGASECTFVGLLDVDPGWVESPPGAARAGSFRYHHLAFGCVGNLLGGQLFAAAGSTGTACGPTTPTGVAALCGVHQMQGFASGPVNGNAACVGRIGGPQLLTGATPVASPWSFVGPATITGSIDASCGGGTGTAPGTLDNATGAFVAAYEPVPTSMNSPACSPPPPLPPPAASPAVWFCQVLVEGRLVLTDTTP